ncbi:hypothetical protein EMIT047CA2_40058 [Pseudomonas soli]
MIHARETGYCAAILAPKEGDPMTTYKGGCLCGRIRFRYRCWASRLPINARSGVSPTLTCTARS